MYYEIQIIDRHTNRLIHSTCGDKSIIDDVLQQFSILSLKDLDNYTIESKTTCYQKEKEIYIKRMAVFKDLSVFLTTIERIKIK